jgi:triacylglycerol lipase
MDKDVAATIASLGTGMSLQVIGQTRALFTPAASDGVEIMRDLAYGDGDRQRLDVYRSAGTKLPILIHFGGGGFVAGDKRVDDRFFGNIGAWFARQGFLTVTANYRLAPADAWPAGTEDVGLAIHWARENGARHGGDPDRIFLWGLSAGATHIASYLFDPAFHRGGVAGAVLSSGLYRFTKEHLAMPNMRAYLGEDESQLAARSPITHARQSKVPVLLTMAQWDATFFAQQTLELASTLCERDGTCPPIAWLAGHNHFSPVFSVGTEGDAVGPRLLDYFTTR